MNAHDSERLLACNLIHVEVASKNKPYQYGLIRFGRRGKPNQKSLLTGRNTDFILLQQSTTTPLSSKTSYRNHNHAMISYPTHPSSPTGNPPTTHTCWWWVRITGHRRIMRRMRRIGMWIAFQTAGHSKGGNETTTLAREKNMVVSTVKTNCGSKYTWNQMTPVWIGKDIVNRFQVYPYMCILTIYIYLYIYIYIYIHLSLGLQACCLTAGMGIKMLISGVETNPWWFYIWNDWCLKINRLLWRWYLEIDSWQPWSDWDINITATNQNILIYVRLNTQQKELSFHRNTSNTFKSQQHCHLWCTYLHIHIHITFLRERCTTQRELISASQT